MILVFIPAYSWCETLKQHIPKIVHLRNQPNEFGYDSKLVQRKEAAEIAHFFHEKFSQTDSSDFPIIYKLPNQNNHYLVSSYGLILSNTDFGRRFYLVKKEKTNLEILFQGKGAMESHVLKPIFFYNKNLVFIFAEEATEYLWGFSGYYFDLKSNKFKAIGRLDIGGEPDPKDIIKSYTNPFKNCKLIKEQDSFKIEVIKDIYIFNNDSDTQIKAKDGPIIFIYNGKRDAIHPCT